VVTENSVQSENTGVPIIREIMVATTMSCAWRIVTGEPVLPINALRKRAESHFRDAPVSS